MPRIARTKGEYSTYHIIQRGNERKSIFISDDDKVRFLDTLKKMKEKYNFAIEAYCLMDNHVHLLLNDNGNDISKIVKSINISYVYYFNRVYKRVGHLFQDRFKSEVIEDDKYLLTVSAYIHNNPVKAGMAKSPEEYKWSSFNCFIGREKIRPDMVRVERILSIFSESKRKSMEEYYNYVLKYEHVSDIIDVEEDRLLYAKDTEIYIDSYESAAKFVEKELSKRERGIESLKKDKDLRRELATSLRKNSNLTLKEIGMLCGGFSQSMICKILNPNK